MQAVFAQFKRAGAKRVLDMGCGEGRLLRSLLEDPTFEEIVGMDVSIRALQRARERLRLDRMPEARRARLRLMHSSLTYRDSRLTGFDAAAVIEVVEHFDPRRLAAFERSLFEFARPTLVVVTRSSPPRQGNAEIVTVKGIAVAASCGRSLLLPDIAVPKTLSKAVLMNDEAT